MPPIPQAMSPVPQQVPHHGGGYEEGNNFSQFDGAYDGAADVADEDGEKPLTPQW